MSGFNLEIDMSDMPTPPFESADALLIFLSRSSKEQFQNALSLFSLAELASSFTLLQKQPTLEAKSKLESLFHFVDSAKTLEILGKHFSTTSFLSFLEFLSQHSQYHNRLNFILVGLHPMVFSQALHILQDHHLHILKQEGLLEPLHYQLSQFVHEGESLWQTMEQNIQQFAQELPSIKPDELNEQTLKQLIHHIEDLRDQIIDYLERASTALALVWHTDRIDLIEKLSSINEALQHQLTHFIGHPAFDNLSATGLYAILVQTFSNIFDFSLKDDDAAIEGMACLSIWHLKDYWELGLLPSIQNSAELELNPEKYSEKERWEHQQKLISLVQKHLEQLGIGKVEGLKKAHLFSKSLLKSYIEQYQHLLLDS